ncbi:Carbohydrate esterase 4 protein [Nowakowskiella sp. JEL0407]|nr:Carbohydrate esterase 4 protein [Nowakowskiella sp. JEL0407]
MVEDFSVGPETNKLGGYTGTDGSGTYSLSNGVANWKPAYASSLANGAYWFTQLFLDTDVQQCRSISSFNKLAALSITIGKTTISNATLVVGVNVGCDPNNVTFIELGAAGLGSGSVTKVFEFNLFPKLGDVSNLAAINSIVLETSAAVPSGTKFTIDNVKFVCASTPPYEYCGPNGGGADLDRLPGVRPRVVERCAKPGQYALTFDDGPKLYESDIVTKLSSFGIKATFFMNTNNWVNATTEPYASWIRSIYNNGHQIASHTATHVDLTTLTAAKMTTELQNAEKAFKQIFGQVPAMIRPPYGSYNDLVLSTLDKLNYSAAVLWNLDTNDWQHPDDYNASFAAVTEFIGGNCTVPGSASVIELQHSTLPKNLELLDLLVPYVLSRGYTFVTVAECLSMQPYK